MRKSARYALLIIFLAACSNLYAANDKAFFWQLRSATATVYLMGSIHLATEDFYPLREVIYDAFDTSDSLVVEINIEKVKQETIQQWLEKNGMYHGEESVKDHLSPEVYRQLEQYLQAHELPTATITRQKPGLLATTLTTIQLMKLKLSPELGIDIHFIKRAGAKQNILELETIEQQLGILINIADGDLVIEQTLSQLQNIDQVMKEMIVAWKRGDDNTLAKLLSEDDLNTHPEFAIIYDKLFTQRNIAMAAKIRHYLSTDKTYFVVVGAGHLVGDGNILSLLAESDADTDTEKLSISRK